MLNMQDFSVADCQIFTGRSIIVCMDVMLAIAIILFPIVVIGHYMTASAFDDAPKRRKAHAKASK